MSAITIRLAFTGKRNLNYANTHTLGLAHTPVSASHTHTHTPVSASHTHTHLCAVEQVRPHSALYLHPEEHEHCLLKRWSPASESVTYSVFQQRAGIIADPQNYQIRFRGTRETEPEDPESLIPESLILNPWGGKRGDVALLMPHLQLWPMIDRCQNNHCTRILQWSFCLCSSSLITDAIYSHIWMYSC